MLAKNGPTKGRTLSGNQPSFQDVLGLVELDVLGLGELGPSRFDRVQMLSKPAPAKRVIKKDYAMASKPASPYFKSAGEDDCDTNEASQSELCPKSI